MDKTPATPEIRTFVVGPIQTNCHALISDGEALVVDPGSSGAAIAEQLEDVAVKYIVATHGHGDHIGGVAALKERTGAPFGICTEDAQMATEGKMGELIAGVDGPAPEPDFMLAEGDVLEVGSKRFTVVAAPGHTPGGIILMGEGIAFVGDTIFPGSHGRVDLPGSSPKMMRETLARLSKLIDPKTVLLIGHGPSTVMSVELRTNPYLQG